MAMLSAASSGSSELSTLTESVRRSLTEQGSLQAIRAQLRACVYGAIIAEEKAGKPAAPSLAATADGRTHVS